MKTGKFSPTVLEHRIQARLLIKQLRSDQSEASRDAAARFQQIRSFSSKTIQQILEAREEVRLKHALAVLALEHGQPSWRALKELAETSEPSTIEQQSALAPLTQAAGQEMYARGLDVFLNRWFATYEAARASLAEDGGFLFPFKRQFFICEAEAIKVLGLNPDDSDWERIGWDWVQPRDREAWLRLRQKREQALKNA